MRRLAALERILERLFERPTARLFGAPLERLVVQRRIERAIEEGRRTEGGRTVLPGHVRVLVNPADLPGLGDPDDLADRLATAAVAFARAHRYAFDARPVVTIVADPAIDAGRPEAIATHRGADRPGSGARIEGTRVFVAPVVVAPAARLVVTDGRGRRVLPVDGRPVLIGRGPANDLVLEDPGVSRRHARVAAREGRLVLTDLGSANGTWVGGRRVAEMVLGPGDRIEMGGAVVVVEPAGED